MNFLHIEEKRLDDIRTKAASGEKLQERFRADVLDEKGVRVAAVTKTLYIRKKSSRIEIIESTTAL